MMKSFNRKLNRTKVLSAPGATEQAGSLVASSIIPVIIFVDIAIIALFSCQEARCVLQTSRS